MRKCGIVMLLLALLFSLCACNGGSDGISYADPDHRHIYGQWYDVTPVTCTAAGAQVRYCKLCHAEEKRSVPVPEEQTEQLHDFSDTVLPPTEKDWGYTTRVCTRCAFVVEQADPTPPLYVLIAHEGTVREAPAGVEALLLSDTKTHTVSHLVCADTVIDAELARRLAVAITANELLHDANVTLTVSDAVLAGVTPDTPGIYVGATLTVRQLLGLWLDEGGADALRCLCALLNTDEIAFSHTVTARLALLGVEVDVQDLQNAATVDGVTVYETAVLLSKALDLPLVRTLLAENTNPHLVLGGTHPTVYFEARDLRVTAIPREEGYAFLILVGSSLHGGLEGTLYGFQ